MEICKHESEMHCEMLIHVALSISWAKIGLMPSAKTVQRANCGKNEFMIVHAAT